VRQLLAAGLNAGRVRIGDPTTGRWLHAYERPAGLVSSLAFTPDGGILATGHGATVVFWDVEAGAERGELSLTGSEVDALAFSPDGETLAVGDGHGAVRLWPWRRMLRCT
jgi:WD40 repeat protein